MTTSDTRRLLITSLAAVMALPVAAQDQGAKKAAEPTHCYGVNKCKQTGDCGGPGHSCANQNTCKRQGYIDMDKDTCLRLDGGRLTPDEPKAAPAKTEKKG